MSKYSHELKLKAIRLRKNGYSYNEIRKQMPVAKSTLSLWLKAVPLKLEHRQRLYTKQIKFLSLGAQSQKARRSREVGKIIQSAAKEIKTPLPLATLRLFGAALYWAEGSKGRRFEVTNSDPYLILFMVQWLKRVFDIDAINLKARLNIYPQQNEREIKRFWSALTDIPVANFGKSYVKPLSKNYKKNNLYYGTIRVEVPRGTDMNYRVFAWIRTVMSEFKPKLDITQKKWQHLINSPRPVNLE